MKPIALKGIMVFYWCIGSMLQVALKVENSGTNKNI